MIRVSEAVLPGHPDKLCVFVAESIVQAALAVDPEARRNPWRVTNAVCRYDADPTR